MNGRWAVLALNAYARGLLKFDTISVHDPESILKETIVLDEVYRIMQIDSGMIKGIFNISSLLDDPNALISWAKTRSTEQSRLMFRWETFEDENPIAQVPGFAKFAAEFKAEAEKHG